MKTIATVAAVPLVLIGVLMGCVSAAEAAELPVGTWHMVDAGCSNPNYQYTPEEQAMRDAVHHKGGFWSDDDIVMTSGTSGTWTIGFTSDGLSCSTIQDIAVTYPTSDRLSISFTNGRLAQSDKPTSNREVSCSIPSDAIENYEFVLTPAGFDFILGRSEDCGEYRFKFAAWP